MGLLDWLGGRDSSAGGLLGTSADDPKSAANLALAAGMIRGDFGGGILGYNEAMQQGADRAYKKKFGDQTLEKGELELQQMREAALRQKAIRDELAKMELGGQSPMTARAGNQIPGPVPVQAPAGPMGGLLGTIRHLPRLLVLTQRMDLPCLLCVLPLVLCRSLQRLALAPLLNCRRSAVQLLLRVRSIARAATSRKV